MAFSEAELSYFLWYEIRTTNVPLLSEGMRPSHEAL